MKKETADQLASVLKYVCPRAQVRIRHAALFQPSDFYVQWTQNQSDSIDDMHAADLQEMSSEEEAFEMINA